MHALPNPWSPSDSMGGSTDLARLEAKVDDLITALELPQAAAAAEQAPAGLMSYWRTIRNRGLLVILIAAALAAGGWFLSQRQQKIYQAVSTLELLEPGRTLNMRSLSSSNPIFGGDTYVETQVTKLRSESLLRAVRERLKRAATVIPAAAVPAADATTDDDLRVMRNNLGVWPVRGTSLIEVSYDSPDPAKAAQFVNALTAEYIQSDVDARAENAEQTRAWLQRELEDAKAKLENSEMRLQAYAHSSGLLYTSPKGTAGEQAEDKLQFIAQQLSDAQAKRANLQARYEVAIAKSTGSQADVADNDSLHAIRARLLDLKRERASLASQFTPEYYKLKQVDAEIADLEGGEAKEYNRWIGQLREEYQTEQRHENLVEDEYRKQASLVSDQAAKAIHYNVLKREVETNRNLYDSLLGGMKEAGVNAAARVRNARVVDPATPPRVPYRPNPVRNAGIGLLTGLMLGIGFVLVKESSDRRLRTPGMTGSYLNVPELGVIPSVKPHLMPSSRGELTATSPIGGARSGSMFRREPAKAAPVADAFHSAVTSIFFSGRYTQPPKVVVVSSATAHEGKSTVAGNLAVLAAQIGKRVLLIDGDLRNPRLHKTYSVANEHGLTTLLMETEPLDEGKALGLVQPTNIERLFLLAGGPGSAHLLPLLHSERMAEMIAQFRGEYDLILIDTPPVLPFADARIFGKVSDAVILVVRAGYTSRNLALAAKARFVEDGLPIIGTILNDWAGKDAEYEYSETAYRY